MAGPAWWESLPALRQNFGAIVSGAAQGLDTAGIWQALRDSAANQVEKVLSVTNPGGYTQADIDAGVAQQLKGIGAADVSRARGAAGAIVRANNNLLNTARDVQLGADQYAVTPWSTTADAYGVQPQFRLRVERSIEYSGFTKIQLNEWRTYNLTGPLTTLQDALDQADSIYFQQGYSQRTKILGYNNYTLEVV